MIIDKKTQLSKKDRILFSSCILQTNIEISLIYVILGQTEKQEESFDCLLCSSETKKTDTLAQNQLEGIAQLGELKMIIC